MDRGVHADLPLDDIDKVFSEKYPGYNKIFGKNSNWKVY
jgi:hypothetical protein